MDEAVEFGNAPRHTLITAVSWFMGGLIVGLCFVLLTGILTIQAVASRSGAVVNLNNEVVAVQSPTIPFMQWLAIAVLGALTFFVMSVYLRDRSALVSYGATTGFAVASIALFAWSLRVTGDAPPGTDVAATALGWEGWIQEGGTSPAVHVVIMLTIGAAVLPFLSARKGSPSSTTSGPVNSSR